MMCTHKRIMYLKLLKTLAVFMVAHISLPLSWGGEPDAYYVLRKEEGSGQASQKLRQCVL